MVCNLQGMDFKKVYKDFVIDLILYGQNKMDKGIYRIDLIIYINVQVDLLDRIYYYKDLKKVL